jgi:hypothetical protein
MYVIRSMLEYCCNNNHVGDFLGPNVIHLYKKSIQKLSFGWL